VTELADIGGWSLGEPEDVEDMKGIKEGLLVPFLNGEWISGRVERRIGVFSVRGRFEGLYESLLSSSS